MCVCNLQKQHILDLALGINQKRVFKSNIYHYWSIRFVGLEDINLLGDESGLNYLGFVTAGRTPVPALVIIIPQCRPYHQ